MFERTPTTPPHIDTLSASYDRPLWSVMIPTFNCIGHIKETLESVLVQDPGSQYMQIQVVDDCSTDGSVEELVLSVGKGRIDFYKHENNIGSLRNFESCINFAKGSLVHILHGDDKVKPGFYCEIEGLFNDFPEIGAAFTNFSLFDKNSIEIIQENKLQKERGIFRNLFYRLCIEQLIQPPAIVVKRSVYEKLGSFYAVHFGEDWEMWTRIASKFPIAFSPKTLACYRVSQNKGISFDSYISAQNIADIKKVIDIIQTHVEPEQRRKIRRNSLHTYSIYCMKVANSLLDGNRRAAINQAKNAYLLSPGITTTFWLIRFTIMYMVKFKETQKIMERFLIRVRGLSKFNR